MPDDKKEEVWCTQERRCRHSLLPLRGTANKRTSDTTEQDVWLLSVSLKLQLSDRTYICPNCGNIIDRDKQGAVNIDQEGLRILLSSV